MTSADDHARTVRDAVAQAKAVQAVHRPLREAYDYVVVGAGSAGCIIAAELTATGASVLLLEAGGTDALAATADPRRGFENISTDRVRTYASEPSPALNGRSTEVGVGHILGGGGSVNLMNWFHGFAADYDSWASEGCDGWAAADMLPLLRDLESWEGGATEWRGAGGPIHVCRPPEPHPLARAWLDAYAGLGHDVLDDVNAPLRAGAGLTNMNVTPGGVRASSARALLHPALLRENLTLLTGTQATALTFEGDRCTGVRLVTRGGLLSRDDVRTVRAEREVIISAGAIGSPLLLLRSGIGDADALRVLSIVVVADLPGVGANLQDHALCGGLVLRAREALPEAGPVSNRTEAASFLHSGESDGKTPDLMGLLRDFSMPIPPLEARYGAFPAADRGFLVAPLVTAPTSRGAIRLADADLRTPPVIRHGLLETERDLRTMMRGIEHCRELAAQPAFRTLSDGEASPGDRVRTRDELVAFARAAAATLYHPAGTCRMGSGREAVVDSQLRVHGLRGLRVADSSVMPTIVGCPINAATCAIGLKAARMIAA